MKANHLTLSLSAFMVVGVVLAHRPSEIQREVERMKLQIKDHVRSGFTKRYTERIDKVIIFNEDTQRLELDRAHMELLRFHMSACAQRALHNMIPNKELWIRAYKDTLSEIKDELMLTIKAKKKKKGRKRRRTSTKPRARKQTEATCKEPLPSFRGNKQQPRARKPKNLYEAFEDAVKKLTDHHKIIVLRKEITKHLKLLREQLEEDPASFADWLEKADFTWEDRNNSVKMMKVILDTYSDNLTKNKDPHYRQELNALIKDLEKVNGDDDISALLEDTVLKCIDKIGGLRMHGPSETKPKAESKPKLKSEPKEEDFEELGITNTTPWKEIKKAYRKLAQKWHPDRHSGKETQGKAAEKFPKLVEAFDRLGKALGETFR